MVQVLRQFSTTLSTVIHLELGVHYELAAQLEEDRQLDDTNDFEWLHLLHPFSTVQTLRVDPGIAEHVALALEDIPREMVAEVLPSLDFLCLEDQPAPSVEKFIAARRLSDRPVTVVDTYLEFKKRLASYIIE